MGETKGFLKYSREDYRKAPVEERLKHWKEFTTLPDEKVLKEQVWCAFLPMGLPHR